MIKSIKPKLLQSKKTSFRAKAFLSLCLIKPAIFENNGIYGLFTMKFIQTIYRSKCLLPIFATFLFLFFTYPSFSVEAEPDVQLSDSTSVGINDVFEYLNAEQEIFVITATKTLENIKKAGASMTVITDKELREMGARNVMDALRRVPGLGVTRNSIGFYELESRGIKTPFTEKILFMINSHPYNIEMITGGTFALSGGFVVENIKRIEVIRGPGSSLHGANAFLAVINIITKDAKDVDGTELTIGGGDYGTQKYNILYGKTIYGVDVAANFNFFDTNGFDGPIDEDLQTVLDQAMGTNASLAPGSVDASERKSDFELKLKYKDFQFLGRYMTRDTGPFAGIVNALDDNGYLRNDGYFIQLGYTKGIFEDFSVETKIYRDFFTFDRDETLFPEGFAGIPQTIYTEIGVKNANNGGEIIGRYDINENNKLIVGMMGELQQQWDVEVDANFDPRTLAPLDSFQDISDGVAWNRAVTRTIMAGYIEDIWDINDNWRLIFGGRFDHYSDFGSTFNPRASFIWSLNKDLRLHVLYGSAFRAPTFADLYNKNNPAFLGNPDLDPEEIDTFEFGIDGNIRDNITGRITFFHNFIDEIITPTTSSSGLNTFENSGKAKVRGIELELKMRAKSGSYVGVNYTHQDTKNRETGRSIAETPRNKANFMVNLKIFKYLNWYTDLFLKGKTYREVGDVRDDLAGYGVVNTVFTVKNFFKKAEGLEIGVSINNVLDKDYFDPSPINTSPSDYPNAGRNIFAEMRYAF